MELFHASNQWATRPADERFTSLEEMYAATRAYAAQAREKTVPWSTLRVDVDNDDIMLTRGNVGAKLTHHAFGQLAARVGAPASYLRNLPATLAATNLNFGLKNRADNNGADDNAQMLIHSNGSLLLRAVTSEKYSRVWNYEVIERLIDLSQRNGLMPARPTIRQNSFGAADQRALYASDHDMFAFLMSENRMVLDPVGKELYRGIIVVNSEVGAAALKIMAFYFRDVCGNFIIWGAEQIAEVSIRHVGEAKQRWSAAQISVRQYLDGAASFEAAKFNELTRIIAGSKEQVLDKVFGLRIPELSRKAIGAGYDAVVPSEDGAPNTVWGLTQGLTRASQKETFADERNKLDRAAGKLLSLVDRF